METERLYALLANIPDVVWTSDSEGKTTFISPNVEQVYGFTPDEILQAGSELWLERIHPDDVERVREAYKSLLARGEVFDVEYRIRQRDGHWIWLHDRATASYDREELKYADGVFSDVTARKEAEGQRDVARAALQRAHDELEQRVSERTAALLKANTRLQAEIAEHRRAETALQESRERYYGLFEGIPVGVYQSTPSGRFLNVNPALVAILGYPDRETLLAANAADIHANAADRVRWQTLMEHQGTVRDFEVQVRRYDGTLIYHTECVSFTELPMSVCSSLP
jgi:PAS domain S-box-containing protein